MNFRALATLGVSCVLAILAEACAAPVKPCETWSAVGFDGIHFHYLEEAASAWSVARPESRPVVAHGSDMNAACTIAVGAPEDCRGAEGDDSTTTSGCRLLDADGNQRLVVVPSVFLVAKVLADPRSERQVWVEVVAHEMGHGMGLRHVAQGRSLMAPTLGTKPPVNTDDDVAPSAEDLRECARVGACDP